MNEQSLSKLAQSVRSSVEALSRKGFVELAKKLPFWPNALALCEKEPAPR